MSNTPYVVMFCSSVFVSAISQIMLKKSANIPRENKLKEYLNPLVIFAYVLFLGTTVINVFAYRGVDLSAGPIIESTGYIYIMILSAIFLKEKITKKKLLGNLLILVGIICFSTF